MMEITNQKFIEHGIIFIPTVIDEQMSNNVIQILLLINALDSHRQINLYINSPGGSVFDTMAIYDVMRIITNPVATYCIGIALSAAALLLAAGDKGKRYAAPHSRILLHQVWSPGRAFAGRTEDVKVAAQIQSQLEEDLVSLLAKHTGHSKQKIKKDITYDFWLTALESLKYGIIDQIVPYAESS